MPSEGGAHAQSSTRGEVAAVARIAWLELLVRDLDRSAAFYRDALGFDQHARDDHVARLTLGGRELRLRRTTGALAPAPTQANDPVFQHFAVAVSDMSAAHARVAPLAGAPFSRGGPQHLPARNGGVRAWKFRDPDGHPVELLELHTEEWRKAIEGAPGSLFLGIDHTALACRDPKASLAFYAKLGFQDGDPSHNYGPAQDDLDGLDGVDLRIATLYTPERGPHIELLHYREPPPPAQPVSGDGCFVVTVLEAADGRGRSEHDPDGHALRQEPPQPHRMEAADGRA